ncbi:MAG TPA: PAS domain-containing sensor histidine kinase, partial [Nitrospirae bacterium]|nr:PAS domain-containing sensor histidine kinase [Nitrospirota bacterium]
IDNFEKIFEPFFSTKQNGLGLGLSMTKRVIEEHGGKVDINSIEGLGTDVRFILPLSKTEEKLVNEENLSEKYELFHI